MGSSSLGHKRMMNGQKSRFRREEVRNLRTHVPTRGDLAQLFGCTERWIGELRRRGDLPREGSLPAMVEAWVAYRMRSAAKDGAAQ